MPNQGFLRVMQLRTEMLWRARRHNERWEGMPPAMRPDAPHIKIDWPVTNQNVVWRGMMPDDPEDGGKLQLPKPTAWTEDVDTYKERALRRVAEIDAWRMANGMRRMRHGDKNWHIATEFVVGAADYMKRSTREEQIEFLKGACRWLARRYGPSNVISVAFHFDEPDGNPHAHVVMVPENDKHAVSSSSMFTKGTLVCLQNEMYDGYFAKFGLDRHHHYEEDEVRPKHQTKKEWMEKRQLEAERDEAEEARDAAIAERDAAKAEAEDIVEYARTEAAGVIEKMKAEAKKVAASIIDAARTEAASIVEDARASKSAAKKMLAQAEAIKAAAETDAEDVKRRVVDAAKVLGICEGDDFATAVEELRTALWRQASAWEQRRKRALSPERRRAAEQQATSLRAAADEIGRLT